MDGAKRIACIETGGTTCYIGLAEFREMDGKPTFEFLEKVRIKTRKPVETVEDIIETLTKWKFDSIGIASFGPVDVVRKSPTFGCMLKTPKPDWSMASILPAIKKVFADKPISIESDVYAPAIYHSIMNGNTSMCYITIGTGVGAGVYMPSVTDGGNSDWRTSFAPSNMYPHSECGHFMIKPHPRDVANNFKGACVFHGGCIEGMASALAISQRKGVSIDDVKDIDKDDEVWDIAAYYIAGMIYNITLVFVPRNVVIGGGVIWQAGMLEKVRAWFRRFMRDYICYDWVYNYDRNDEYDTSKNFIVKSSCKDEAGLLGAATVGLRSLL